MAMYAPITVVASGGAPFVQVSGNAPPMTVVPNAAPITLVANNAPPVVLYNPDGTPYAGGAAKAFRTAPDTADSFYLIKNMGGAGRAFHFIRNTGAATDAANLGVKWPEWRLSGISDLAAFNALPTSPSVTYSDDPGAQDLVANVGGVFMGSFHGLGAGGALNSETLKLDGVAFDPAVASTGDIFELTNDTTATGGTGAFQRSLTTSINALGGVHFKINSATGTGVNFAYVGMSIGNGAFDETDVRVSSGGSWLTFANGAGAATHLLDNTYEVRTRDTATGRQVSLAGSMPSVAGFLRGEVVRITATNRSKGYFRFTSIASLANVEWDLNCDVGATGSRIVAANAIANGSFAANITGWVSVIGTSVAWASPGLMRLTREAGLVLRWRWNTGIPAAVDDWVYYSFDVEALTGAAPAQRISPTNGLSATNALMGQATQLGRNGLLKKAISANISGGLIWAGYEYGAGTAGQVTDLDNFVVNNFGLA